MTISTDFRDRLERMGDDSDERDRYRLYKRLDIGKFGLSIQGNAGAYSQPRAVLADPFGYTQMECALFTADGAWVCPEAGNWPDELAEFADPEEGPWYKYDQVAPYVDVETIQRLYLALHEMQDLDPTEVPDTSFWGETLRILDTYLERANVMWVGTKDGSKRMSFEQFEAAARQIHYPQEKGGAHIPEDLVIVGVDWWLERLVRAGHERWAFKRLPVAKATAEPYDLLEAYKKHNWWREED